MNDPVFQELTRALNMRPAGAPPVRFWLRDDDAVTPTAALEHLLALTEAHDVPLTLAVIPAFSDAALAARLRRCAGVCVAVHGWSHQNHAPMEEKKQELGAHRPVAIVLEELARGRAELLSRHGDQLLPVLVPPWNRIAPEVLEGLAPLGYLGVSVFGAERDDCPVRMVNTHIDVIDWRGTRGGRSEADLLAEIVPRIVRGQDIGVLTHHLVHDAAVWQFLERLFATTAGHPACRWVGLAELLNGAS
ncbi:polysaccharide deacetylase [Pseudooceanicola sediminis]|uniref:Polysaccharide deacetylase n=1 Tax=Pseudooceanicola sediminis TaxID=2211117 RepID=A0A399IZN0_9RHOB|nr:polysaccharide deacetylase family protein [Pseudooceanicola sediminis]RII37907.1 polysaccharide deacetylase [Pseudooceanicola sediminis]|tara:strand:+ start:7541 stop:8281 length:741 start_codon:yes stop_codon:yes gene_type:complete